MLICSYLLHLNDNRLDRSLGIACNSGSIHVYCTFDYAKRCQRHCLMQINGSNLNRIIDFIDVAVFSSVSLLVRGERIRLKGRVLVLLSPRRSRNRLTSPRATPRTHHFVWRIDLAHNIPIHSHSQWHHVRRPHSTSVRELEHPLPPSMVVGMRSPSLRLLLVGVLVVVASVGGRQVSRARSSWPQQHTSAPRARATNLGGGSERRATPDRWIHCANEFNWADPLLSRPSLSSLVRCRL